MESITLIGIKKAMDRMKNGITAGDSGGRTRRSSELKTHVDGIRVPGSGREKRYYDTNRVG